ncbi:Suppressor of the cold-sensitive snRNP bioproteinsis mutant brr1-1 [Perkinsus olseni]|uniref:subtilisin n=1 Tax=Perkinsus olseni TaxID=32597 RepID=A0A7J6NHB7_PEROL|nr:Suppressor of the cold-sensitive snRNP bioproteinsis mutant brr1-1 [Perkinsus olseni]
MITFVDVKDIHAAPRSRQTRVNTAMAAFLKTAAIKTLKYSGLRVVSTSDDTVGCTALCDYVKDAASKLRDLELIASRRNDNHDMAGMSNHLQWHMAEAMEMAVDIRVDIVSISHWAFKAATDQSIIVVASAGNDGLPADTHYHARFPACSVWLPSPTKTL